VSMVEAASIRGVPGEERGRPKGASGVALGVLRDAWLFLGVILLVIASVVVLRPARFVDRVFGTRTLERLVHLIERLGEI